MDISEKCDLGGDYKGEKRKLRFSFYLLYLGINLMLCREDVLTL